ncbi:hypothetical protein MHB43_25860 [Paenibacillus sp. FSL H8-0317]|uniref:hypothetical protein n=1 Tax=Paenibacillus TaxID=44249 RepID=UPI001C8DE061|nr:hypothetical protein [Paenibacillus xylanexedens]MBY0116465.1 hypothetical protein [Paenibacillus xylanexedens]
MVRRSIRFVSTTSQSRLQGEYPSWDVLKRNFLREVFLRSGDENPNGSSEHSLRYVLYVAALERLHLLTL